MLDPSDLTVSQQEEHGRLYEAVQKAVDGLIEDVKGGHVPDRGKAAEQAVEAIKATAYCRDFDQAVHVLRYCPVHRLDQWKVLVIVRLVLATLVLDELTKRPEYRALPEGSPTDG